MKNELATALFENEDKRKSLIDSYLERKRDYYEHGIKNDEEEYYRIDEAINALRNCITNIIVEEK